MDHSFKVLGLAQVNICERSETDLSLIKIGCGESYSIEVGFSKV